MKLLIMMRSLFFIGLSLIFVMSCGVGDEIEIRVENVSDYDFEDVTVVSFDESINFADIKSGDISSYQIFQQAYSYSFVSLKIDEERYVLQPIDFVGEEELKNGKYTYQISADTSMNYYGRLGIMFIED